MNLRKLSVENYRSFDRRQEVIFSDDEKNATLIYGPNGAGKSNFFKALLFVCTFIETSTKAYGQKMTYDYFVLKKGNEKKPTVFSIELQSNKKIFEYTFSLLDGTVRKETLKLRIKDKDESTTLFSRNSLKNGDYDKYGFTSELLKSTRPDALVLTRGYEVNNSYARDFFELLGSIHLVSGKQPRAHTAKAIIKNQGYYEKVLELLKRSDLFIRNFAISERKVTNEGVVGGGINDNVESNIESTIYDVATIHYLRDETGKVVGTQQFNLKYHESEGTNRIFELAYPILDTLENGCVLYIDDFDATLHTNECRFLINLFSGELNKKGAHLIINTHRETLMDEVGYKNILLFGKDNYESTIIGKMSSESRDKNLAKKYMRGDFGAVPRVEDYK